MDVFKSDGKCTWPIRIGLRFKLSDSLPVSLGRPDPRDSPSDGAVSPSASVLFGFPSEMCPRSDLPAFFGPSAT